jgi:hypothetical protein
LAGRDLKTRLVAVAAAGLVERRGMLMKRASLVRLFSILAIVAAS